MPKKQQIKEFLSFLYESGVLAGKNPKLNTKKRRKRKINSCYILLSEWYK